jgi:hypothetical protein
MVIMKCCTKRFWIKTIISFFIVSIFGSLIIGISLGLPQDIGGTWNVASQIVTQCNDKDPYAPQPGTIMPSVTWTIANSDNGPILTSDKGSVTGQYTISGATFEFTVPMLSLDTSHTYCLTRIECLIDSASSMYGTIENHYRTYNYFTGPTIETCIESFKFKASKLQA